MAKSKSKGSGGGNDRDVLFRLGVEAHPGTKSALQQLATEVKKVQKDIVESMKAATDGIMEQVAAINRANSFSRVVGGSGGRSGRITIGDDPATGIAGTGRGTGRGGDGDRSQLGRHLSQVESDYRQHGERLTAHRRKVAEEHRKILEREAEWEQTQAKKREIASALNLENDQRFMALSVSEMERVFTKRMRLVANYHDRERKSQEDASALEMAQLRQLERVRDTSLMRLSRREMMLPARLSGMIGSVTQLTRGLALLGTTGEEASEKLVKKLIAIQSGFDMVVGTVRTLSGFMRFGRELSMLGNLANRANAAQAGIDAITGGGGAGGGSGGGVVSQAASSLGGAAAQMAAGGIWRRVRGGGRGSAAGRSRSGSAAEDSLLSQVMESGLVPLSDGFDDIYDKFSHRSKKWQAAAGRAPLNIADLAKKESADELIANAMGETITKGAGLKKAAAKWVTTWDEEVAKHVAKGASGAAKGVSSAVGDAVASGVAKSVVSTGTTMAASTVTGAIGTGIAKLTGVVGTVAASLATLPVLLATSAVALAGSLAVTVPQIRKHGWMGGADPGTTSDYAGNALYNVERWVTRTPKGAEKAAGYAKIQEDYALSRQMGDTNQTPFDLSYDIAMVKAGEVRIAAKLKETQRDAIMRQKDIGLSEVQAGAMTERFGKDDRREERRLREMAHRFRPDESGQRQADVIQARLFDVQTSRASTANMLRAQEESATLRQVREGSLPDSLQRADADTKNRLSGAQGQLTSARQTLAEMEREAAKTGIDPNLDPKRNAQADRVAALHEKVAALTESRLEVEKQIASTRKASIQESIEGLQNELSVRRQAKLEAEDTYKSGKVRFGEMTTMEQQSVIRIKQKADAAADAAMQPEDAEFLQYAKRKEGAGGNLTADEEERLEQIKKRRAAAAAAGMTRQERQKLSRVQSWYTGQIAEQGNLQSAEAAGYDRYFGEEERRNIGVQEQAARRLEFDLKGKREIVVNSDIQRNLDMIVDSAVNAIRTHLEQYDRIIDERIQRGVERGTEQVMVNTNAQLAQQRRNERSQG